MGWLGEKDPNESNGGEWERGVLEKVALASVKEQRAARRWGIFFKFAFLLYLITFLAMTPACQKLRSVDTGSEHTAVVDIFGAISAKSDASADKVVGALRSAFENEGSKGVVIRINSPGGSPVQSDYIYQEIKRLRAEYPEKRVYAAVYDICASGGYYIAAAADEIYANESSMVGSIGVVMSSFGFTETLEKLGVERRLMTAGENKGFLDPFSPEDETHVAHVKTMLEDIHQTFINRVKEGRGERLKASDEVFSGLIWTGRQAKELGLVDGFGSASYIAREVIGAEKIVSYNYKANFIEKLSKGLGSEFQSQIRELSVPSW